MVSELTNTLHDVVIQITVTAPKPTQRPINGRKISTFVTPIVILNWSAGQMIARFGGRKVRSPQGNMPANGRGSSRETRSTESATEKIPPDVSFGKGEKVR
jgi:hypothetical protein